HKDTAVQSEATFGPNLSRVAYKIAPEGGDAAARRWLVQWIVNPNVHSPRTRMPITHLSPKDARDIAAYLLSRKGREFDDDDEIVDESEKEPGTWSADVPAVNPDELAKLARLFLVKVPGFTPDEVDTKFLSRSGDTWAGIPPERFELGRV